MDNWERVAQKLTRLEREIERLKTAERPSAQEAASVYASLPALQGAWAHNTIAADHRWQAYTPSYGGFSADPSIITRYLLIGKLCTVVFENNSTGTSNANTFTMSAPFTAASVSNMVWRCPLAYYYDNSLIQRSEGYVAINPGESTFVLYTSGGAAGWTASGAKSASGFIIYEVA